MPEDHIDVEAYNYKKFQMDDEEISAIKKLLQKPVTQNGNNFTLTQRKLIILGKAL